MKTIENYNDLLSVYQEYPAAIRPFLLHADTHPLIRPQLGDAVRLAFIDLVARANIKNPLRAIFVRVDRTARKLGISEKSVSRALNLMLKNDWLDFDPAHDGRDNRGKYAYRRFLISTKLRTLIGLPTTATATCTDNEGSNRPMSPVATDTDSPEAQQVTSPDLVISHDATVLDQFDNVARALQIVQRRSVQQTVVSVVEPELVEPTPDPEKHSGSLPDQNPSPASTKTDLSDGLIYEVNKVLDLKEASFQRKPFDKKASQSKTPRIPDDLKAMQEELDITPAGMCTLMGLAKLVGQRLQDIWKVKADTLRKSGAKNGRAFNYIRKLLKCGEDFSYVARVKIPSAPALPANRSQSIGGAKQDTPSPLGSGNSGTGGGEEILNDEMSTIAKTCRHKRFRHISNGAKVRVFDGTAEVMAGAKLIMLGGWAQMCQLYRDIALGNLLEIRD